MKMVNLEIRRPISVIWVIILIITLATFPTTKTNASVSVNSLRSPMVAAGNCLTVGLRFDGTVIAAGSVGLDVSDWTNITMVAAGDGQTVGLKSDGTVVATGSNSSGQCNVNSWNNITQVAAGMEHTVGLKSDGTVVVVGQNSIGQCDVSSWTGITQIAAGNYRTVGLKSDGTVVATGDNQYGECNTDSWKGITQVASGYYSTVGLKSDGTVVAVGFNGWGECNVGNWDHIIQVTAGGTDIVGLKSDGTVVAVGDNDSGQCNVDLWRNIIQVAAGYGYTVGLKSDGTVVAAGRDLYGETNVNSWYLDAFCSWFFSQNDPQWEDHPYPTYDSTISGQTIGIYGCATSCAAMVLKYYGVGVDVNPDILNNWLSDPNNSGYDKKDNSIKWDVAATFGSDKLSANHITNANNNKSLLDNYLDQGYPVIVHVTLNGGMHWVVVTHKVGDTYAINDPWYYPQKTSETLASDYNNVFQDMVVFYPTPVPVVNATSIQGGGAYVADNNAIALHIIGSSAVDGTSATLTSAYYGGISPPGTTTLLLAGPSYYDINIGSVSNLGANAVADVYISNPLITSQTLMQYWNGQIWNNVPNLSLSGTTISGFLPMSALGGTPFVIGNQSTTSITLTSSANSSNYGQSVTFTADVNPITDGGTVQFQDNGVNLSPQINIDASGQVIYTTSNLSVESHTITAVYAGDAYFMPCTANLTQVVNASPHLKISADDDVSKIMQSAADDFYNDTGIVLDITTESDSQAIQDLNNGNCDVAGVGYDSR
jgi:Bacterial Ig-like domain (group 3)/Peptidase_C39 like family/Regulator of chromosome condensation (RCC1) repeat